MPIALAGLAAGRRGGIAKAARGTAGAGRAGRVVLAGVAATPAKRAAAVLVAATVFATVAARPAHRALALQYSIQQTSGSACPVKQITHCFRRKRIILPIRKVLFTKLYF